MRHPSSYLLLTAAAGCTPLALASSEAVPDGASAAVTATTAAEVKVAITGCIDLTANRRCRASIEFLASPKLTAAARASLVSSDFEPVDTRGQVSVMYKLDGAFQALHPATRCTAEVRVGDYAKNPALSTTKGGRGGSTMPLLDPLAMLIGTIASNTGNATGTQDSVNTVMAGDPDDKCLSRCETWRYRQCDVVSLARKEGSTEQECSVLTTVEDTELVPVRLAQSSFADLQGVADLIVALSLPADSALVK